MVYRRLFSVVGATRTNKGHPPYEATSALLMWWPYKRGITEHHYGSQSVVMFDSFGNSMSPKTVERERRATQSISADILFECELNTFLANL